MDIAKGQIWDADLDVLPLMPSLGTMLFIISAYLLFVLKVGPNLMNNKTPYQLTYTLVVYNVVQVIFSAFMAQRYLNKVLTLGLFPRKCVLAEDEERKQLIFNIWIYFVAKFTELLDTVFFVLRKKDNQVSFLHLYHHSLMFLVPWVTLKYWPSHLLYFAGFLNSLVHLFMYFYYGLAAFGPTVAKYLTWKKYITTIQLIQFVIGIIHYLLAVQVSECPPAKGIVIFSVLNVVLFFVLFLSFYIRNYTKNNIKMTETNDSYKIK